MQSGRAGGGGSSRPCATPPAAADPQTRAVRATVFTCVCHFQVVEEAQAPLSR